MKPEELKFSKEHEWVAVQGDVATIGITDWAQDQLGEIVYIELPEAGETFTKMDKIGTIESVKTVSDLFIPVGGEIAELNTFLLDRVEGDENPDFHPEYVNEEPYGNGWMFKVKMSEAGDLNELLSHDEYQDLTGDEA